MKIAHVTMFYTPAIGGVKQVVYELAQRQIKAGHEVHVYCCDSDKNKRIEKKEEIIEGVHVHRCKYWFRLSRFTYIWPSLLWKLNKEKFDIIHSHVSGHAYVFFAGLIAKLKKTPYIHTTHCPWTDAFRALPVRIGLFFADKIFNRISYALCSKIIAITPWELKIIRSYGAKNSKVCVIPNGVDNILFKTVKPNKFKEKLGIESEDMVVLFFGRLNITKGPEKLVLAAREILRERDEIHFVFIGPDEGMRDKIAEMIKTQRNTHLLGPIKGKGTIAEMYQGSDLYALPSYREGLPLTLFEAMSCGLPIVASPVNGVPYEMDEPENGFFVKYGDFLGLKDKILTILDHPQLAKKIAYNNKLRAKRYTWDSIAKRVEKVYKEISNSYK